MEECGVQFVMNILTKKTAMLCVDSWDLPLPSMLHLILSKHYIFLFNDSIVVFNSLGVVRDYLHITNITCAGSETNLWDCPFDNATVVKCNSNSQVAVHCGMLICIII